MHSVAAAIKEMPNPNPHALSEAPLVELKALDGESGSEFWLWHELLWDLGLLSDQGVPLCGISFLI